VNPPRLALVHGFTQTSRSWDGVVPLLRDRLRPVPEIVAVDAPGHGDHHDLALGPVDGALAIGAEAGRATYVGYSMGGRLCLHLALARPDLVEALVLIGATAGIDDDVERAERRAADEALATEIEQIGVDEFLDRWLALPLFAGLPREGASVEDRRRNTVAGLASSLRLAGTGAQAPLWDRLGELRMPVLVLAGERDEKFLAIGRRIADRVGSATFATVAAAGHAAHLEQPDRTVDAIASWWVSPRVRDRP
jgi:2-succinyl-6-hydroxy-2,4-cyclohexadiene-1-carboxylate synthase